MPSEIIIQNAQYDSKTLSKQLKCLIFQLFSSSNKYRNTNKSLGVLLMLLCFIQISSFIKFHVPNEQIDEYQAKYPPISIFLNINIYLFPDMVSESTISKIEISIYCIFLILILLIVLIMYFALNSLFFYWTSFVVKYAFLLLQWVLFLPLIQVLIQAISFNSGANIPKSIIHIILVVVFAVFQCALSYFNLISSTNNEDFFYSKDATIGFNLFFIQIASLFLGIFTYSFPIVLFIDYIIIIGMLVNATVASFKHFALYSKGFLRTYIVLLCMLHERLLNSMINKYTLSQSMRPFRTYNIVTIAIMVFSYVLIEKIFFREVIDYSLRINVNKIKTTKDFVKFFSSINDIILTNRFSLSSSPSSVLQNEYSIKLIGLTMNHLIHCSKEEKCLLKSKDELYLPRVRKTSLKGVAAYNDQVKLVFMIKELFNKFYQSFQFDFEFCLCYILFIIYTVGNNELALSEIEMSKRFVSLSLSQEFIMHLLKEHTNSCIMNICEQQNDLNDFDSITKKHPSQGINSNSNYKPSTYSSSTGNNGNEITFLHNNTLNSTWTVVSMLKVINYDKVSTSIKNYIYLSLDTKRELWKLFLNEDIIIEEVFLIGQRFFEYKARLILLWNEISVISNDQPDTEITRIYCDYLDKICDDKIESRFIMEKTPIFISNTSDELYNNRYKADTGIVIIEVNCALNPGKMIYINQPLVSMLGYHKNELIDNNVKVIIPSDIGRYHDEIIINYFEKGRSDVLKKTMNTLCVKSKEKYLIPIHLLLAILPNFGKKMEGIGLIRPQLKKKVETIIATENGVIEALTENMGHLLNITPSLIEKSHIYVQSFFPELMKPEKLGGVGSNSSLPIPRFMTKEYFGNNKPIDFKINILCPQKNSIDKTKLKVRTRNIFICQSHIGNSANDNLSTKINTNLNAPIKVNVNTNPNIVQLKKSDMEPVNPRNNNADANAHLIQNNIHQSQMLNQNSLTAQNKNQLMNPITKLNQNRSLFTQLYGKMNQYTKKKAENIFHLFPLNDQLTPEMDQITKYLKAILDHQPLPSSSAIANDGSDSNNDQSPRSHQQKQQPDPIKSKMIEIYNSMLSTHDYHTLTEKAEVILIHLGMSIYNHTIPLRILMIPSEMLFEEKKNEEDFSLTSEVNIAEKKDHNLIQKANEDGDMDQFFDIGSVSGKDANVALQKHLKKLKKDKNDQFLFHRAIGLLMGLTVIATELAVIFLSNSLYAYVMNFNTLIKEAFTLNTLLIDISKYSIIDQLERKYSMTNAYFNYNINAQEMRVKRSRDILGLIDNYFASIQSIYSPQMIDDAYNGKVLNFLLTNRRLNMTFINSIYHQVTDAIDNNLDSLKAVSVNYISTIREHFTIISDLFNNHYLTYSNHQYVVGMVIVTISLIILILFLIALLYSYRIKQTEQTKLLSAYEQITNEEIENIINALDQFEVRYLESFKQFEEYKKKKITFQKENTQFLFKKYQNRLKSDQKEEERKYTYNILSNTKVNEEEIEEKTKKNLINRQKMTKKYLLSFFAIFSIVMLYTGYFYYEICYDKDIIKVTQTLVFNLFHSKFLLDYISFKLINIVYRRMHVISNFDHSREISFKAYANTTHTHYNYLTILINSNSRLFLGNITQITTGRICDVLDIAFCELKDPQFKEENGMRAITAFYFKSIEDAFLFYNTSYKRIDDLGRIFSDAKFSIINLLIENLEFIYDEIFVQMNTSLERLFSSSIVNLVVISIVSGGMFIIGLVYKLISFIEGIKQEESLCKKLIAELPYEVVKGNYDIQKQLTGILVTKE